MPQVTSRFLIYAFVFCRILENVICVFVFCRILEHVIYVFALCRILEHVIYVFVFCRILERVIYALVFPPYSGAHNLCVRIPPVRAYPLLGCIPERILYVLFYIPLPLIVEQSLAVLKRSELAHNQIEGKVRIRMLVYVRK
jgi:hypothetical protein